MKDREIKAEPVTEPVKLEKVEKKEPKVEVKEEFLPMPNSPSVRGLQTPPRNRSPCKVELPTIGGIPLPTPKLGPDSPKLIPKVWL